LRWSNSEVAAKTTTVTMTKTSPATSSEDTP
jgi:hypothetical protein